MCDKRGSTLQGFLRLGRKNLFLYTVRRHCSHNVWIELQRNLTGFSINLDGLMTYMKIIWGKHCRNNGSKDRYTLLSTYKQLIDSVQNIPISHHVNFFTCYLHAAPLAFSRIPSISSFVYNLIWNSPNRKPTGWKNRQLPHPPYTRQDDNALIHEQHALCLLDFHVHESFQRRGIGRDLFTAALKVSFLVYMLNFRRHVLLSRGTARTRKHLKESHTRSHLHFVDKNWAK